MDKKIKVLFYGDGVGVGTGFGVVNTNIAKYLLSTGKYEVHNLAINYHGDPIETQKWENLYLYPTIQDPYGRNRLYPLLMQIQPDILFLVNDFDATGHVPEIVMEYKRRTNKHIETILHTPMDGEPLYPEWAEFLKKFFSKVVVVSKYGVEVFKRTDKTLELEQRYHGVDLDTFKPLPEDEVSNFKKQLGDKFVVSMVGTNQLRKQYPIALEAFAHFAKDKNDVLLFLHTQRHLSVGWNLDKLLRLFNITDKVVFTDGIEGAKGIKSSELNMIYNISDVYLSTAAGEGFSLTIPEAAAAGCPLILPDNTSIPELWEGAAHMIPTSHYTIFPNNDRELIRPIPSSQEIIKALDKMYYDKAYREEMGQKARARVLELYKSGELNWVEVGKYFDKLFTDVLTKKEDVLDIEEIL